MSFDALMAKQNRALMRYNAIAARMEVHPRNFIHNANFGEITERAARSIGYAMESRDLALRQERRVKEAA